MAILPGISQDVLHDEEVIILVLWPSVHCIFYLHSWY